MIVPFKARTEAGGADANGLLSFLERCRSDLDNVRQDIAWSGGNRTVADIEGRLSRTADHLEQAIGTFVRLQRLVAAPQPLRASTPILAREADHRVKNGLTTVIALLQRQASTTTDGAVGEALRVAGARVAVVAQMHALLSDIALVRGEDRELALDAYLPALGGAILNAMDTDDPRPVLRLAVEPLSVTPNTAQTLGLVVAELMTNAMRHAFPPGRPGAIEVTGERVDGDYLLSVRDDGKGMPDGFDPRDCRSGLGLRLVGTLADQLHARLVTDCAAGTRVTLLLHEPLAE